MVDTSESAPCARSGCGHAQKDHLYGSLKCGWQAQTFTPAAGAIYSYCGALCKAYVPSGGEITLVAGPSAAAANVTTLQAAVTANAYVAITAPGTYYLNTQIRIPSNRHIYIGQGVTLAGVETGWDMNIRSDAGWAPGYTLDFFSGMFSNSDWTGGNSNITITGKGRITQSWDVNTGLGEYLNVCYFENVDGLYIGDGLTIGDGIFAIKLALVTNFTIRDVISHTNNTVPGFSAQGDNTVFITGGCSDGLVENIRGISADDGVVCNNRDIDNQCRQQNFGSIRNITIRDVFTDSIGSSGSPVAIYAEAWIAPGTGPGKAKPTVTLSVLDGLATAVTNVAHGMIPGSHFRIASSSVAGYNTTAANFNGSGGSTSIGTVVSVPSATSFTYYVPTATAGVPTGAVLTIYYDMHNITIDGVLGNGRSNTLLLGNFTTNEGAIDSLRVANVYQTGSRNLLALVGINLITLFDAYFDGLYTGEAAQSQVFTYMINNSYLAGQTIFRRLKTITPFTSNVSGVGAVNLVGFDDVTIEDSTFNVARAGATTFTAIQTSGGKSLTLKGLHAEASGGQQMFLFSSDNWPTTLIIRDVFARNLGGYGLLNYGGSNSGAHVLMVDGLQSDRLGGKIMTCYIPSGSLSVSLNNIALTGQTDAVIYHATGSGSALDIAVGAFSSDKADPKLLDATSTIGAGGATVTVDGINARVDLSKISRKDGAIVYNTNAALGTLGVAGLVAGQGTAANSWHLLSDPTKVY